MYHVAVGGVEHFEIKFHLLVISVSWNVHTAAVPVRKSQVSLVPSPASPWWCPIATLARHSWQNLALIDQWVVSNGKMSTAYIQLIVKSFLAGKAEVDGTNLPWLWNTNHGLPSEGGPKKPDVGRGRPNENADEGCRSTQHAADLQAGSAVLEGARHMYPNFAREVSPQLWSKQAPSRPWEVLLMELPVHNTGNYRRCLASL